VAVFVAAEVYFNEFQVQARAGFQFWVSRLLTPKTGLLSPIYKIDHNIHHFLDGTSVLMMIIFVWTR
jgi:hypothetical protein